MKFRMSAFALHLLASALALMLTMGTLYAGWYRWPGWYLADVVRVFAVMAGVDLVLGPVLTFTIASPKKPRPVLRRDIALIAVVQVLALAYGTVALWNGRPLYYAFSVNCISVVQAYDVEPDELALARKQQAPFVPHWYSLPRWIWAPLPSDAGERNKIVSSAIQGGGDVITMPRFFRDWDQGLPDLKSQLQKVDDIKYFTPNEKTTLKVRLRLAGFSPDQIEGIAVTGRGRPLLAIVDPVNLKVLAMLEAT